MKTTKKVIAKKQVKSAYSDGVEVSEFQGKPTIKLPLGKSGSFFFSFGLSKAKAIVKYLDDIKRFINENNSDEE